MNSSVGGVAVEETKKGDLAVTRKEPPTTRGKAHVFVVPDVSDDVALFFPRSSLPDDHVGCYRVGDLTLTGIPAVLESAQMCGQAVRGQNPGFRSDIVRTFMCLVTMDNVPGGYDLRMGAAGIFYPRVQCKRIDTTRAHCGL